MGDRVADHEKVDISFLDSFVDRVVPLQPSGLVPAWLGTGGDDSVAVGHPPSGNADVVVSDSGGDFFELRTGRQADIKFSTHRDFNGTEFLPMKSVGRHVPREPVPKTDEANPVRGAESVLFDDVFFAQPPLAMGGCFASGFRSSDQGSAPMWQ